MVDNGIEDFAFERDLRGWRMRHGHRRRLARELGRESHRGRATFARSINCGSRKDQLGERKETLPRRFKQRQAVREAAVLTAVSAFDAEFWQEVPEGADASFVDSSVEDLDILEACVDWVLADDLVSCSSDSSLTAATSRCSTAASAPRPSCSRWEAAQERAKAAAESYRQRLREAGEVEEPTLEVVKVSKKSKELSKSSFYLGLPKSRLVGRPCSVAGHARAMEFVPGAVQGSHCWCRRGPARPGPAREVLNPTSHEYEAVTSYFIESMASARGNLEVLSLERLWNDVVYSRYVARRFGEQTVMFHGCKTSANERSIITKGFQVSKCVSGGSNYGTWFAYNANYSNSGFVYCDEHSIRHIFVCVVSDRWVVRDDETMRVVAQDCAYPLWLLRYKWEAPPRPYLWGARSAVRFFHEVRNGSWVKVSIDDQG